MPWRSPSRLWQQAAPRTRTTSGATCSGKPSLRSLTGATQPHRQALPLPATPPRARAPHVTNATAEGVQHWWERDPDRLQWELERFRQIGLKPQHEPDGDAMVVKVRVRAAGRWEDI